MTARIVIQDYAGHPFQVQLSRKLAERGHHVLHLYAGYNQTPRGTLQRLASDSPNFAIEGLYIRQPLEKYRYAKRWFQEREYGKLVLEAVAEFAPDAVISANMPLGPQRCLQAYCENNHVRFIFWMQDIVSLASRKFLRQKIPVFGGWIGNRLVRQEAQVLARSDQVVTISDDFAPFLQEAGVRQEQITLIPNWAPLDELPVLPKQNAWACANGLNDRFCFLYSGTLGLKHKPDLLLQIALEFREDPGVVVFVASEGPGAEWLAEKRKQHALTNLILGGYQPMSIFPQVLAAADVLLAVLDPQAGDYSVPSKVLSYLAAQRPLLLAVPVNNLAARIVCQEQAGVVVDPADPDRLLAEARELTINPALRGRMARNARRYAEQHFDIGKIADRFEVLL